MRRLHPILFCGATLLAVGAWPADARPQEPDAIATVRARFEGEWRLAVSRARARQVVDAAIEEAVGAMSFFVRGIARGRLSDGTPVVERITLRARDDGRVTVSFDGRRYTTRLGRTQRLHRVEDGEPMRVTQRLRPAGQLEQVFQTDGGTRWYVYTATERDTLEMESTTHSDRMPEPMVFRLDYRRE